MEIEFTPLELAAFRSELFKGFTDNQFNMVIADCQRRGLVPGRHVFPSLRASKEWDSDLKQNVSTKKVALITTIDAMRLIRQRTGEYEGMGEAEYIYLDDKNAPSIISTIPLPHPTLPNTPREPWAARVPIFRKGFKMPVQITCRFDAYAVTYRKGDSIVLTEMWQRRGPEQLAKCCESASTRAAFAEEVGKLFLSEEFEKEDRDERPEMPQPTTEATIPAPQATVVPTVNNAPVQPTGDPRPNEPQPTLVDLILDRSPAPEEAKPVPVVEKKSFTTQEVVAAAIKIDSLDGYGPLPNEAERKATGEQIRSYTANPKIVMDHLRAFILKKTGFAETKLIPQKKWLEVLAEVDAAFKKSPETLRDLINPPAPPQTEEEPF